MIRTTIITLFLVFVISASVSGQDEELFVKDVLEVNLFGGIGFPAGDISEFSDTIGANTGLNYGLDIGYFLTYDLVLGLNFTYTGFSVDDQSGAGNLKHKLYNPNLYAKYYFSGESDFMPYLKANVGVDFPKFTTFVSNPAGDRYRELSYDPVLAYGIGGGLFVFTSDFSGLFIEANYHRSGSSKTEADYLQTKYVLGADIAQLDIHGGIRILIGPGEE